MALHVRIDLLRTVFDDPVISPRSDCRLPTKDLRFDTIGMLAAGSCQNISDKTHFKLSDH